MTDPGCCASEIEKLMERINQVAATVGDPLGDLAHTIQGMILGETDPYLLAGVLIEGAAQSVLLRIPAERRIVVSIALLQLLQDRLNSADDQPQSGP